jgi:predicted DNA-binding transcriptional regulator AlpA
MNESLQARKPLAEITYEPVMVDAKTAASLCGVSRSTWLGWDSAGLCPQPVRLGGRVLWAVDVLRAWAWAGCPSRVTWLLTEDAPR